MSSVAYERACQALLARPRRWLVTGAAGFIGSNLVEALLRLEQTVVGFDNFATGYRDNLEDVHRAVGEKRWQRFRFVEADIRDFAACRDAVRGVDHVLHHAALVSVQASISDPASFDRVNVGGFLNILVAAKEARVESLVYASSSAIYGDDPAPLKVETSLGDPLSPYAATKAANELYANVFRLSYDFPSTGLRYFNIFGPRQDPEGAYAAVVAKWMRTMIAGDTVEIYGDGETSRDFCYVEDAVQANVLAALAGPDARGQVYNVAVNKETSLKQLFTTLVQAFGNVGLEYPHPPVHGPPRAGEVRHSRANICKAEVLLGLRPKHTLETGLTAAMPWFVGQRSRPRERLLQ